MYFLLASKLILNGNIIHYDDTVLVNPLLKIDSFKAYWTALKNNQIWDIQPIRDLSYIIDIQISNQIKAQTFHLTNFFIWSLIFIFFYQNLKGILTSFGLLKKNTAIWVFFFSLFFYFHPVFQLEPFWISSRKHLLSTLFVFISFYNFLLSEMSEYSKKRYVFFVPFFYALSVFSQPITLPFPIFLVVYSVVKKSFKLQLKANLISIIIASLIIMFLAIGVNYYFYYTIYPKITGGLAVNLTAPNMLQIRLLTLGRFFYQIFDITMASAVEHDRGSVRNIIGLLSLPIFIYLGYKLIKKSILVVSLAWFFFPIAVVILGDVKLFALDTYLVTSSFGIFVILTAFFQNLDFKKYYYLLLIPNIYLTHDYSNHFFNTLDLSQFSQKKEITSFGQYMLTNSLLSAGKYDEAFEEAYAFSKVYPEAQDLKFLLPISLWGTSKVNTHKKREIFKQWKNNSFFAEFYYSTFYPLGSRDFREAQNKALLRVKESFYLKELNIFTLHALAFYNYSCKLEKLHYCDEKILEIKKQMPPGYWNESIYRHYLIANYLNRPNKTIIDQGKENKDINKKLDDILMLN